MFKACSRVLIRVKRFELKTTILPLDCCTVVLATIVNTIQVIPK